MDSGALEVSIDRLRKLILQKVPDLLLQAECGGGLELPTPLPWGFASVPTLYDLAGIAEREVEDLRAEQERSYRCWREARERHHARSPRRNHHLPANGQHPAPHPDPDWHPLPGKLPDDATGREEPGQQEMLVQQQQHPHLSPQPAVQDGQYGPQNQHHHRQRLAEEEEREEKAGPSRWEGHGGEGAAGFRSPPGAPGAPTNANLQEGALPRYVTGLAVSRDVDQEGQEEGSMEVKRAGAVVRGDGEEDREGCRDTWGLVDYDTDDGATVPTADKEPDTDTGAADAAAVAAAVDTPQASGGEGESDGTAEDLGGGDGAAAGRDCLDLAEQEEDEFRRASGAPSPEPSPLPPPSPEPSKPYACRAFRDGLEQSRSFRSPHCEVAMAEAMGLMEMYDGLAGSMLAPPPAQRDLEALRALLKGHINARWSLEAVKQGVAAAKQGNYADAHQAYARALELDPGSAEAYVARGAALANQRAFADAERDLRRALELDPGHRNAATYLDAVLRHVEGQRHQPDVLEERQQQLQPQQQQRDRRRWMAEDAAAGGADGREGGPGDRWADGSPDGCGVVAAAVAVSRPVGHGHHPSAAAPSRPQREPYGASAPLPYGESWAAEGGEGRRRRDSDSSDDHSESTESSSDSGRSNGGTPGLGHGGPLSQPASKDIRRALEVVLKARKQKKKPKHKKQKKKHRKSKRRKRD